MWVPARRASARHQPLLRCLAAPRRFADHTAAAQASAPGDASDTHTAGDAPQQPPPAGGANALLARYRALLAAGALLPDARQAAVVGRLAALLDELRAYAGRMQAYHAELADFKARRRARLQELEAEDERAERAAAAAAAAAQRAQHAQQQEGGQQTGAAPGLTAWLSRALGLPLGDGSGTGAGGSPGAAGGPELTPQQRAHLAAQARRARVARELGPGPRPPPAPRGAYIHGSVGSGKSVLMDMFFEAATGGGAGSGRDGGVAGGGSFGNSGGDGTPGLQFARRMHFNAAMLDLHSRLHLLDLRREARQHGHATSAYAPAAAAVAAAAEPHTSPATVPPATAGGGPVAAVAGGGGGGRVPAALLDRALEIGEELEGAAAAAAEAPGPGASGAGGGAEGSGGGGDDGGASDGQVARWFDPGSWRDKEAKAAVLAVRRHIREQRAGRVPRGRLAAANAAVMRAAARSFIRARGADPSTGWDHGRGHAAALLCFDEMQVTDVWTAAALKALFEALTAEGCVVVVTSNRTPHELPRHGLHEAMWEHFIDRLLDACDVVELSAAEDYRRRTLGGAAARQLQLPLDAAPAGGTQAEAAAGGGAVAAAEDAGVSVAAPVQVAAGAAQAGAVGPERLYFWPLGPAADESMEQLWARLAGGGGGGGSCTARGSRSGSSGGGSPGDNGGGGGAAVPVLFGRRLEVPRAGGGAAWFHFSELCARPLGSADYMALSHAYHTVFVTGVPAMSMQVRDQARRFITLVDELYNARTLLVASAAAAPDGLFSGAGEEPILDLEALQFETAVEGSKLRRDLLSEGGVAPVASSEAAARAAAAALGGAEERFAFARAVSRLYEMQSPLFFAARPRGAWAAR